METTFNTTNETTQKNWLGALLLLGLGAGLVIALDRLPFDAVDWYAYQEIQDFWHPYRTGIIFNPPWTFWLLWPLLKLPVYQVGALRLLIMLSLSALVLRRGGGKGEVVALATSMPFLYLAANGNIDWLAGLAFLVEDKGLALPLLLVKPQVGIFAVLAWLRKSGWRILLPAAGVALLSLAVYGWWPAEALANIQGMGGVGLTRMPWNASLFPWGAPLGLWLAWLAWKKSDEFYGVSATLLLFPYYGHYTLSVWYALALTRFNKTPLGRLGLALFWLGSWVWYFFVLLGVRG